MVNIAPGDDWGMVYGIVLLTSHTWGFPQIRVPKNSCFIMEKPIKIDDLRVPPILGNLHISFITQKHMN